MLILLSSVLFLVYLKKILHSVVRRITTFPPLNHNSKKLRICGFLITSLFMWCRFLQKNQGTFFLSAYDSIESLWEEGIKEDNWMHNWFFFCTKLGSWSFGTGSSFIIVVEVLKWYCYTLINCCNNRLSSILSIFSIN